MVLRVKGPVAGIEVGEGAAEGVPLFVRMVMKFSIHAYCSGVNTSPHLERVFFFPELLELM